MAIYKRGDTYWYEFRFNGERIQQSAQTENKDAARQIEAAHRVRLAKGEAGIHERPPAPTLEEFAPRFEAAIVTLCAEKPATVSFYKEKLRRILADRKLSAARLDAIDEAVIDGYKQRRTRQPSRYGRPVSPASVNRELATLRRLLRLAQEWKVLDRVPRIRLLRGERNREFVLSHALEPKYLEAAPQPLRDVAILILETAVRPGEAVNLRWQDVYLQPAVRAKFGYIAVRVGKSRNAKRNLSLTARAAAMLKARKTAAKSVWVFPGDSLEFPFLGTSIDHQHRDVRDTLKLSKDFVVHSLRHTMLTRLGEAGADAFTIMRIAGHSSVTVSQRYVHPTPEGMERAFERLQELNATKFEEAKAEAVAVGAETSSLPAKVPTANNRRFRKSAQVVAIKRAGP
ncbi:MAG TPA: site-specific integrase [Bryobacteraceae bacterium]|nr:site-specific integrase [Bryobacteraceae bacterium]